MRFREAVFAEAQDLLVDLPRERFGIAARAHAVDQALLEFLEAALAPPRRHRAAQVIGLAGVKPAATIASCITCSWKIGTPSVRSSTPFTAALG